MNKKGTPTTTEKYNLTVECLPEQSDVLYKFLFTMGLKPKMKRITDEADKT